MVFNIRSEIPFSPGREDKRSPYLHITRLNKEVLNCCRPYETSPSVGLKFPY